MRILITGAAGFVGSHLAEALVAAGHDVVGLDCFDAYYSRELKEINAADLGAIGVPIERLDLAIDDLSPVVPGVDVVYHLAAQPGISATTSFDAYLRNNVIATQRLIEAFEGAPDLRLFVNIATSSVYGAHATDSEEAAAKPTSNYGVTKLAAEQLVLSHQRERAFPGSSLRLFSVYGPRERPEKLFPRLLECLYSGEEFPLYAGSEDHIRTFTYVGDAVAGLAAVLDHVKDSVGEIFNIGSTIEQTTGAAMAIVEGIVGKKVAIRRMERRPGDQLHTRAAIDKARRVLGYEPSTQPDEGLRRTVEWYRERVLGR